MRYLKLVGIVIGIILLILIILCWRFKWRTISELGSFVGITGEGLSISGGINVGGDIELEENDLIDGVDISKFTAETSSQLGELNALVDELVANQTSDVEDTAGLCASVAACYQHLPLTGGTLTGKLTGTTAKFSSITSDLVGNVTGTATGLAGNPAVTLKSLTIPTGAVSGYVLQSDATGKASWSSSLSDLNSAYLAHGHDSRYYTEAETNTLLGSYLPLTGGTLTGNLIGTQATFTSLTASVTGTATGLSGTPTVALGGLTLPTGAGAGYVLTSDAAGVSSWQNLASSLLPVGTEGQTLYNNAGTWTANSGIFYDDINSRVGIGTVVPSVRLDVKAVSGSNYPLILTTSDWVTSSSGTRFLFGFGGTGNTFGSINVTTAGGASVGNLVLADAGGFVGIADTSPDYLLELYDATNTPVLALSDDDVAHGLTTLAETDVFSHLSSLSTTAGGVRWTGISDTDAQALDVRGIMGAVDPTDATPAIKFTGAKSNGTTGIADLGASETVFQIANNDDVAALTVLGNGNLGIGTVSPATKLYVYEAGASHAMVKVEASNSGKVGAFNAKSNGEGVLQFGMYGTGVAGNTFGFANAGAAYAFTTTDAVTHPTAFLLGTTSSQPLILGTTNLERVRIDGTTGYVGIGAVAPGQALEVNGGIRLNTVTAKPTCDASARGTTWFVQGGAGVKDTYEVCAKDAGDAYSWRTIY